MDVDPYGDNPWRKNYLWFNLAHVCRKWRAVVFASCSRMNLAVVVGPIKPVHIKAILSSTLPILFDFSNISEEMTSSALRRMHATLKHHHGRVREIIFEGSAANFEKLFRVTNHPFPVLESLSLWFEGDDKPKLPDTFLRGPDLPDLHLRHLSLFYPPLSSIFGLLSSPASLTDLELIVHINSPFSSSSVTTLLASLQSMSCLQHLCLDLSLSPSSVESPSQTPASKDIVPLSKLTSWSYTGHSVFLEALAAGLSAPSLRHVNIEFCDAISPPTVHTSRFINEIVEEYYAVHVAFDRDFSKQVPRLRLFTHSEYISHCRACFQMGFPRFGDYNYSPESIFRMSEILSARLSTVEVLRINFGSALEQSLRVGPNLQVDNIIPWRMFLQWFPRVKAIRMEGRNNHPILRILLQNREGPNDRIVFLPALEEIELDAEHWLAHIAKMNPS